MTTINTRGLVTLKALVSKHGHVKVAAKIKLNDSNLVKKWIRDGHIPWKWSDTILQLKTKGLGE